MSALLHTAVGEFAVLLMPLLIGRDFALATDVEFFMYTCLVSNPGYADYGHIYCFSHVHITLLCTQCFYTAGIPGSKRLLVAMM